MNIKEIDDAKLQEAIASFEAMHGAIEEVCPQFIRAIVEFTQEGLRNKDNFINWCGISEIDPLTKARILLNHIYEGDWALKYREEYKRIEFNFHSIKLGDEIDTLMVKIVYAIATQEKPEETIVAMRFLHLSQITIDLQTVFAVEWDRFLDDCCTRITIIKPNIPGLAAVQLYSSLPNYEGDKIQLMMALSKESSFSDQSGERDH